MRRSRDHDRDVALADRRRPWGHNALMFENRDHFGVAVKSSGMAPWRESRRRADLWWGIVGGISRADVIRAYAVESRHWMPAGACPRGSGGGHDSQVVIPAQAGIQEPYRQLETAQETGRAPPASKAVDASAVVARRGGTGQGVSR